MHLPIAVVLAGISSFATTAALAQTAGLDQPASAQGQRADVIVTSQRREESLQINTQILQSNPTIIIRGVASGTSNNAVDPKAGIYLGGVLGWSLA